MLIIVLTVPVVRQGQFAQASTHFLCSPLKDIVVKCEEPPEYLRATKVTHTALCKSISK